MSRDDATPSPSPRLRRGGPSRAEVANRGGGASCAWRPIVLALALALSPTLARADTCGTIAWEIVHERWSDLRAPDPFGPVENIQAGIDRTAAHLDSYARNRCDRPRLSTVLGCTETDDGRPVGSRIKRTGKTAATEDELRRLFDSCWRSS